MACEILSQNCSQTQYCQENIFNSNMNTNEIYNGYMEDSDEDVSNEIVNIQLYYENQLLHGLLKEQQNEVQRKQNQIDQLQEKISVLLNAFVLKAREDKRIKMCTEKCKEEKKFLERDIMVKTNAYQEVETKFMEMNRYLQEVEDQNKKLLTEISILTEKETIRQLSESHENLVDTTRSCISTPNPQDFPKIRICDKEEKVDEKFFKRSKKIRLPMKKAKSFNLEKAMKANSKKEKLF